MKFDRKHSLIQTSIVTFKGQIVIPVKLRKKAGIKPGTRVYLEEKSGDIIIHPATPDFYQRTYGILKGEDLIKTLEESRRKDKEDEDTKIEER